MRGIASMKRSDGCEAFQWGGNTSPVHVGTLFWRKGHHLANEKQHAGNDLVHFRDRRVLLDECQTLTRGDQRIHIAGIDDAHFYRADDIEIAASDIPKADFSILL